MYEHEGAQEDLGWLAGGMTMYGYTGYYFVLMYETQLNMFYLSSSAANIDRVTPWAHD